MGQIDGFFACGFGKWRENGVFREWRRIFIEFSVFRESEITEA